MILFTKFKNKIFSLSLMDNILLNWPSTCTALSSFIFKSLSNNYLNKQFYKVTPKQTNARVYSILY